MMVIRTGTTEYTAEKCRRFTGVGESPADCVGLARAIAYHPRRADLIASVFGSHGVRSQIVPEKPHTLLWEDG
jgi:hypothetical protein